MSISIDQIKSLRDRTGVSITACKKALEEAQGDEAKAIEILRKKGEAKIAERTDRSTSEGVIRFALGHGVASIVKLASETDFVAKSDGFVQEAQAMAEKVLAEGEAYDFSNELSDLNIKMGEKVELAGVRRLEAPVLGAYVHSNNKIGVLIALDGGSSDLANDIAMHIAAMNPATISPNDVDDALVAKERVIWEDQLQKENKPKEIAEKIMQGKEAKFRGECALLTQSFVKNPDQTIQDVLAGSQVIEFVRFEI